jgi:hypothetical protein
MFALTRLRILSILVFSVTLAAAAAATHGEGAEAHPPIGAGHEGEVVETMNAGAYTYVRVKTAEGEMWAAGPQTAIAVGDVVAFGKGATMTDFHSPSLDRTFESIEFVGAISVLSDPGASAGKDPVARAHATGAQPEAAAVEPVATAEGGVTIEELYARKSELAGKGVIVRGRVVKYNSGILGRNWVHIQDGTGSGGTHDLTVTTDDTVSVGDVVLVRGTAAVDRDFGMGYRYDLIVEEADVTAEP